MEISKYIKKIDVVEEKGKVFVHLHQNRANNPNFIKKILSKYNLGEILYKKEDLYVYEIPVRNYKIKVPPSPSVEASELEPELEEMPAVSPPKRTRRTRRSSRKSTKTTNDS